MKVGDLKKILDLYPDDLDIMVFIKCQNSSMGIDQVLQYNSDLMIYLDSNNEKKLKNIAP